MQVKKLFTLLMAAVLAVTANAQVISFTADDVASAGQTAKSFEKDGLVLNITDTDGKISIDKNTAYFGSPDKYSGYKYRLKSGGKSSSKNNMSLTLPSAGTLKIAVRTGSNSATDRTLVLTQDGKELYNNVVMEANSTTGTVISVEDGSEESDKSIYTLVEVAASAGEVSVTYPIGALNFYAFELVATEEPDEPDDPNAVPAVISFDENVGLLESYNVNGLKLEFVDEDEKMSVDASNSYFGTADNYVKYTSRLKTGGKSSSKNAMTLTIPAAGTLSVCARTANLDDNERTLVLKQKGRKLCDQAVNEECSVKVPANDQGDERIIYNVVTVSVKAGMVSVEYPTGALNFYAFDYVPATYANVNNVEPDSDKDAKTYNVSGQQVDNAYKGVVIRNGKKYLTR